MATSKWLQIDGIEYQVGIVTPMKRKGDILDLTAARTEDGVLHRDVIGTFYNYTLNIIAPTDQALYEAIWWKLTEPVASHMVQLPYQTEAFEGYFGSVQDDVKFIDSAGNWIGNGISCNLVATRPSRTPNA